MLLASNGRFYIKIMWVSETRGFLLIYIKVMEEISPNN